MYPTWWIQPWSQQTCDYLCSNGHWSWKKVRKIKCPCCIELCAFMPEIKEKLRGQERKALWVLRYFTQIICGDYSDYFYGLWRFFTFWMFSFVLLCCVLILGQQNWQKYSDTMEESSLVTQGLKWAGFCLVSFILQLTVSTIIDIVLRTRYTMDIQSVIMVRCMLFS